MTKLKEVMTRDVETVDPGASVRDVAVKMKARDLGSVPVCEGGKLLGVITDRDITLKVIAEGRDPAATPAREVMNRDVLCCAEEQSIEDAAQVMERQKDHRVFVIDPGDRLVGIVSLGKVARSGDERLAGEVVREISRPRGA